MERDRVGSEVRDDPLSKVTAEPPRAAENVAEVEDTDELAAERREREERQAPDLPDRAFDRITPQV